MTIVQIEHPVRDFEQWKNAFDNDPVGRKQGGVQRYRVFRPVDDPHYVIIDLEFAALDIAQSFLEKLRALWSDVQGTIIDTPRVRVVTEVESITL